MRVRIFLDELSSVHAAFFAGGNLLDNGNSARDDFI